MLYRSVGKRKILLVALVLMLLVSAFVGMLFVNVGKANPYAPALNIAYVTIKLPENKTYYTNNVPVSFKVESQYPKSWAITSVYGVKFYLDGDSCENARIMPLEQEDNYVFSSTLVGLKEGPHSVHVVAYVTYESSFLPPADGSGVSEVVEFTVAMVPPRISILSPEPKEYNSSELPLLFTLNEPVSQMVYCLDDKENLTLTNNATLYDLSEGRHTLVIYATDVSGNTGTSEERVFNVIMPNVPNPFPTNLVIAVAIVISAIIVGFGLLAYFVRRNRRRSK